MFIIVGIPVMVILVMLLAAVALAVQVAPIILFCIKILFIAGYWFFGICAYLSSPNRKENSSFSFVLAIIGHCIGGVITYYLFDVVKNVKTIIILLLINFIIMSIIDYFGINLISLYILLVLLIIWIIGYDLSYNVKKDNDNIKYVKCIDKPQNVFFGRWEKGHIPVEWIGYVFDNIYEEEIVDEKHILEKYKEGDGFLVDNYNKDVTGGWYRIITDDGKIGYIHKKGMEKYYEKENENIINKQKEKIEKSWYNFMPYNLLNKFVFIYEHSWILCQINFFNE